MGVIRSTQARFKDISDILAELEKTGLEPKMVEMYKSVQEIYEGRINDQAKLGETLSNAHAQRDTAHDRIEKIENRLKEMRKQARFFCKIKIFQSFLLE